MSELSKVASFPEFLDHVGHIDGEEDRNEQESEDRAGVRDRGDTLFSHLLLGPARRRDHKNLVEEQPF